MKMFNNFNFPCNVTEDTTTGASETRAQLQVPRHHIPQVLDLIRQPGISFKQINLIDGCRVRKKCGHLRSSAGPSQQIDRRRRSAIFQSLGADTCNRKKMPHTSINVLQIPAAGDPSIFAGRAIRTQEILVRPAST